MENKEILKWINKQIKCKAYDLEAIKRCKGPICINPDPIKEDLKILNQIKKELEEKDTMNYAKLKCETAPVLDDVEKRYLKNVIRPFKDKCEYVEKLQSCYKEGWAYILIVLNDTYFELPRFEVNTMYKNMVLEKRYSLDELGIKYEKKE